MEKMEQEFNILNISNFVSLEKKGKNFVCCCPFHKEDTPSFVVSPDKNIATCFGGCNRSWDYVGFYADYKQISRKKAYAELTGEHFEEREKTPVEKCLNDINSFYEAVLNKTKKGLEIVEYFKERGFSLEDIQKFRIGFSHGKTYELCKKLEYNDKIIQKTGGFNEELKDSFSGRITFPIFEKGQVLGFTCRVLNNDDLPKYLNTKETEIFKKKKILFNLDKAKNAIKQKDFVIICEGTIDAMSYCVSGVENVVATCGVALSQSHLWNLKKYTNNICLAFDNDQAGIKATIKSFKMLKQMGFEVTILDLKKSKDANEYMVKFGRDSLKKVAENQISMYAFLYKKGLFKKDINTFFELLNLETSYVQEEILKGVAKFNKSNPENLIAEFTSFQELNENYLFECILYKCLKDNKNVLLLKKVVNANLLSKEEKEKLNKIYLKQEKGIEYTENSYDFKVLVSKFIAKKMENLNLF